MTTLTPIDLRVMLAEREGFETRERAAQALGLTLIEYDAARRQAATEGREAIRRAIQECEPKPPTAVATCPGCGGWLYDAQGGLTRCAQCRAEWLLSDLAADNVTDLIYQRDGRREWLHAIGESTVGRRV